MYLSISLLLQVCDISGSKVWAYLEDSKNLGTIQASDIICVYEVAPETTQV